MIPLVYEPNVVVLGIIMKNSHRQVFQVRRIKENLKRVKCASGWNNPEGSDKFGIFVIPVIPIGIEK
jgi:hypothetical protein